MKIKIANIEVGRFSVRDNFEQEHVEEIKSSFEIDGQWNPIIVRPTKNGKYEVISGHYRLQAGKELGWDEIEAIIKDFEDVEAEIISLKANLMHSDMTAMEKGKVLNKIINEYGITQVALAEKLGISKSQIGQLLTLALSLHKSVAKALEDGEINYGVASVIGSLDIENQSDFLEIILSRKISKPAEAYKLKAKFLNDTIYTIGYQGRKLNQFIEILKNNEIKVLLDIRHSAKSTMKPNFSKEVLERELERIKIKYIHIPELGIPFIIQTPYKEGKFSIECLKQWYSWHIENEVELEKIITNLKDSGRSVLMCMEKYAKKMREQNYACHRDILANIILSFKTSDSLLKFENRVDL